MKVKHGTMHSLRDSTNKHGIGDSTNKHGLGECAIEHPEITKLLSAIAKLKTVIGSVSKAVDEMDGIDQLHRLLNRCCQIFLELLTS